MNQDKNEPSIRARVPKYSECQPCIALNESRSIVIGTQYGEVYLFCLSDSEGPSEWKCQRIKVSTSLKNINSVQLIQDCLIVSVKDMVYLGKLLTDDKGSSTLSSLQTVQIPNIIMTRLIYHCEEPFLIVVSSKDDVYTSTEDRCFLCVHVVRHPCDSLRKIITPPLLLESSRLLDVGSAGEILFNDTKAGLHVYDCMNGELKFHHIMSLENIEKEDKGCFLGTTGRVLLVKKGHGKLIVANWRSKDTHREGDRHDHVWETKKNNTSNLFPCISSFTNGFVLGWRTNLGRHAELRDSVLLFQYSFHNKNGFRRRNGSGISGPSSL